MELIVYNKETYEMNVYNVLSKNDYKLKENEAIYEKSVEDTNQTDIRVYKEDGSVKTLEEQVAEGIITLADNEIIRNGKVIEKLNKYNEEDLIILIERGIEELDPTQKIVEVDGLKKIERKKEAELYADGLISKEEYNEYIRSKRKIEYMDDDTGVDKTRWALINDFLLSNYHNMTETQKEMFDYINSRRAEIKKENPKV